MRALCCVFVLAGCIEPDLIACPPPANQDQCASGWQPIDYPDIDMNVLSKTLTTYVAGTTEPALAFTANMHTNNALTIRIAPANGTTCLQWQFLITDAADFSSSACLGTTPQTFTTTRSNVVVQPGFHFTGTGAATIDYLEYGSDTPTFTKAVTWAP